MTDSSYRGLTDLIDRSAAGEESATEELVRIIKQRMHRRVSQRLRDAALQTMVQPTQLIHDAVLKLIFDIDMERESERSGSGRGSWFNLPLDERNRHRFWAILQTVVHNICVDLVRKYGAKKRKGDRYHLSLHDQRLELTVSDEGRAERLDLQRALDLLREEEPVAANIVLLKFYCGCGWQEIVEATGLSRSSAIRKWQTAERFFRVLLDCGEDA